MIYQNTSSSNSNNRPAAAAAAVAEQATDDNQNNQSAAASTSSPQQHQHQVVKSPEQQVVSSTSTNVGINKQQVRQPTSQLLQQQRPIRPNLRRQVVVAARDVHHQASVPIGAQIELATVLSPSHRAAAAAKLIPPQRPAHLPASYDSLGRRHAHQVSPAGAAAAAGGSAGSKPNRYAWAHMQHWQDDLHPSHSPGGPQTHAHHHHGFQHHFSAPFSSAASRVLVVNPMQIVNLSEHTKSRLIKFIEAVKRFSEKWFSHVLLLMFLAVYACFGAYIFISFEAPTEQWEKQQIIDTRLRIVNESWQAAHDLGQEEFVDVFRQKFEEYERLLNRVCAAGMTSSSMENQWTFWGALFYSMTVFTTIGYGHLTPITFAGRCATMVYAIFGIPILLMVLADLGKLLTRIIKSAFKKFRYLYNKLLGRKASIRTRKLISDNTSQYIGVARDAFERGVAYIQPYNRLPLALRRASFRRRRPRQEDTAIDPMAGDETSEQQVNGETKLPEGADHLTISGISDRKNSVCVVTPVKATKPVSPPIGSDNGKQLGDQQQHHQHGARSQSPGKHKSRKISASHKGNNMGNHETKLTSGGLRKNSISRSSTSSTFAAEKQRGCANANGDELNPNAGPHDANDPTKQQQQHQGADLDQKGDKPPIDLAGDLDTSDDQMNAEFEDVEDDFDIPVSFALFLLVTYMMFGAVVFSIWEGWNFFDSLYFVFISMSTIGFGDLVPQHPKRMIGTFIYLLLGLALTSMCINVVQEKIHATFLRAKMQIGEKMGLDLDQIMADDYYDGSLAMDGDEEDDNSVAVSQTNSSLMAQESGATSGPLAITAAAASSAAALATATASSINATNKDCDPQQLASQANDGSRKPKVSVDGHTSDGLTRSARSKDSIKWKKRSASGGLLADHTSGSLRRKASRRISRQSTPVAPPTHELAAPQQVQPQQLSPTDPMPDQPTQNSIVAAAAATLVLHPEFEVRKIEGLVQDAPQPSINSPVNNVKGICEPLDRKLAVKQQQVGVAQLHQVPNSNYASEASMASKFFNEHKTTSRSPISKSLSSDARDHRQVNSRSPGSMKYNSVRQQNHCPPKAHQHQPQHLSGRSEGSSRRASVSHELNQLDDLIKALSKSPSERFGPLLGVPSSRRSSGSSSPGGANSSSATNSIARRGTSMTSRRPGTSSPQAQVQKKRSLATVSPPTPQQLNQIHGIPSESQMALDELEFIKYSAV